MSVSYKRLWKLLIDKEIRKGELFRKAELSGSTISKLNHNENVNIETLTRICRVLECTLDDICEVLPLPESKEDDE